MMIKLWARRVWTLELSLVRKISLHLVGLVADCFMLGIVRLVAYLGLDTLIIRDCQKKQWTRL